MITRLRKLFYGSKGWVAHLIPGAAGVKPLYEFQEEETGRRDFEAPGPNVIEFVDRKPKLLGAPAVLANPADVQEVLMPDGDFVDVGHVLAGLDAMNHPTTVAPYYMYEMSTRGRGPGDLGSVLGEVIFQRAKLGRPLTGPEVQAQVDEMAPAQDMLGNVDSGSWTPSATRRFVAGCSSGSSMRCGPRWRRRRHPAAARSGQSSRERRRPDSSVAARTRRACSPVSAPGAIRQRHDPVARPGMFIRASLPRPRTSCAWSIARRAGELNVRRISDHHGSSSTK
jgi:hypothetical protein